MYVCGCVWWCGMCLTLTLTSSGTLPKLRTGQGLSKEARARVWICPDKQVEISNPTVWWQNKGCLFGKKAYSWQVSHAPPRTHRSCLSVSSWNRSSNVTAQGVRWWELLTWIFPSDGPLLSRDICLTQRNSCESCSNWSQDFWALLRNRSRFWRLSVLWYAIQLSYTFHNCYCHCCHHPSSAFCSVVPQPSSAEMSTVRRIYIPLRTYKTDIREFCQQLQSNSRMFAWKQTHEHNTTHTHTLTQPETHTTRNGNTHTEAQTSTDRQAHGQTETHFDQNRNHEKKIKEKTNHSHVFHFSFIHWRVQYIWTFQFL